MMDVKKLGLNKIIISPLDEINVKGGNVLRGIKLSEKSFNGFGELYFSWIDFGFIKAWKKHTKMTMNLIVPFGDVKFVFYDEYSKNFKSKRIGTYKNYRITVPPGIWFGFKGMCKEKSLVTNLSNIEHSDNEVKKKEANSLYYKW